jgi:hypothetical protein
MKKDFAHLKLAALKCYYMHPSKDLFSYTTLPVLNSMVWAGAQPDTDISRRRPRRYQLPNNNSQLHARSSERLAPKQLLVDLTGTILNNKHSRSGLLCPEEKLQNL